MTARLLNLGAALLIGMALSACGEGSWFGGKAKPRIEGERIAVLPRDLSVEADPRLAELAVLLPPATVNADWPQPGGGTEHAMGHLAGGDGFRISWRVSVGEGTGRNGRVTSQPVVAEGRVYVMDAAAQVSALDAATGERVWRFDVTPEGESAGGVGGGVAYAEGRLFVTTGYAQILALDGATGKELWRSTVTAPLRAGPTVINGRLFAISIDNQLHAIETVNGKRLWVHSALTETAGFYGGASPAVAGDVVIAPFSSGELFALRADNGRVLWSDSLAGLQRADALSGFADIRGLPVVDRGQVFAASHAGRMAGIDIRTGGRIWDRGVGSLGTPWLAGEFIFVTTVEGELLCLTRRDGRLRWVQTLPRFRDEKQKRGRIIWTGPVLVEGRLFVAGSNGEGLAVDPGNGEIVDRVRLPGPVLVQPAVAGRTVYVLTDDADLVALR